MNPKPTIMTAMLYLWGLGGWGLPRAMAAEPAGTASEEAWAQVSARTVALAGASVADPSLQASSHLQNPAQLSLRIPGPKSLAWTSGLYPGGLLNGFSYAQAGRRFGVGATAFHLKGNASAGMDEQGQATASLTYSEAGLNLAGSLKPSEAWGVSLGVNGHGSLRFITGQPATGLIGMDLGMAWAKGILAVGAMRRNAVVGTVGATADSLPPSLAAGLRLGSDAIHGFLEVHDQGSWTLAAEGNISLLTVRGGIKDGNILSFGTGIAFPAVGVECNLASYVLPKSPASYAQGAATLQYTFGGLDNDVSSDAPAPPKKPRPQVSYPFFGGLEINIAAHPGERQ